MTNVLAWQRLDNPTHERAFISTDNRGGVFIRSGITGVFEERPVDLEYTLQLRPDWSWQRFEVTNRCGPDVRLHRKGHAALDLPLLDFFLTPATNMLPIRRLGLAVGERCEIETVYFHPETFEPGIETQAYERVKERLYRFSSDGGRFAALLEVDADGWVRKYEGLFRRLD